MKDLSLKSALVLAIILNLIFTIPSYFVRIKSLEGAYLLTDFNYYSRGFSSLETGNSPYVKGIFYPPTFFLIFVFIKNNLVFN